MRISRRGRTPVTRLRTYCPLALVVTLSACEGRHSWLAGAGAEARAVEALFWPFLIGSALVWTAVMVFAAIAYRVAAHARGERIGRAVIIWGGVVAPTIVVAILLVAGLLTLKSFAAKAPALTLKIDAEQWWWRVTYDASGAEPVVAANEIRLPQGETAELLLTSDDVIHSFWAPALGGKMDMIPGRTNRLTLTPVKTGSWGGVCAEYCGGAHAQMRFDVVVMEPEAFQAWLSQQARAAGPGALSHLQGLSVFLDAGCGACHTVRGTGAGGRVGPDLTHLSGRDRIGAGLLPMTEANLARWITHTDEVKPGVRMPAYPDIPDEALDRLTAFLMALK